MAAKQQMAVHETAPTQIAVANENELIKVLSSSLYPGAAEGSVKLVLAYCKAAHLDPMQKPVHIVPMWDKGAGQMRDVIMPGIGLYRTQAARTGECAGISEPEFGPDVTKTIDGQSITFPEWCKVTVKRSMPGGGVAEFPAIERWIENYAVKGGKEKSIAPNAMWTRRPYAQIAKCAEAQALRKAFPEFGAQPTADEMEGRDIEPIDVTPPKEQAPQTLPEYPADKFDLNFPKWRAMVESGKSTVPNIIATVSTRNTLTADQLSQIKALKLKQAEPAQPDDTWGADYDAAQGEQQ